MYLDSKGFVTIGVGHLIENVDAAKKLPFQTDKGLPATEKEIETAYNDVLKQPKNKVATFYRKATTLSLKDDKLDELTNDHIDSFEKELKLIYPQFDTYPKEVRFALFDMIFNLGASNLKTEWKSFNQAIKDQDWGKAAKECKRKHPVSDTRNNYVKDLLETADKAKPAKPKPAKPVPAKPVLSKP